MTSEFFDSIDPKLTYPVLNPPTWPGGLKKCIGVRKTSLNNAVLPFVHLCSLPLLILLAKRLQIPASLLKLRNSIVDFVQGVPLTNDFKNNVLNFAGRFNYCC